MGLGDGDRREVSADLLAERERRLELERKIREIEEQGRRLQQERDEADRLRRIRDGLSERGVRKADLAVRIVRDDVRRGSDGELLVDRDGRTSTLDEYLDRFVAENPEFLPPRIPGGSGATSSTMSGFTSSGVDLDSIRPGMSGEDSRKAWREVARLMGHREI
ncbi:MAG: hypothetical protein GC160_19570 [Acidobacteria bacterium]|nr:hypothetical protein [Acidobacteriota bacterium]